jgi:DNA-binding XRE family transcriptional regulator
MNTLAKQPRPLREARLRASLSQAQLADLVGVRRCYIGHLETGYKPVPSLRKGAQIVRALRQSGIEVTLESLFPTDEVTA